MHRSHTGIRDADDIEPLRNASAPAGIPFSPMYLMWESSSSSFLIRKSIAFYRFGHSADVRQRHVRLRKKAPVCGSAGRRPSCLVEVRRVELRSKAYSWQVSPSSVTVNILDGIVR